MFCVLSCFKFWHLRCIWLPANYIFNFHLDIMASLPVFLFCPLETTYSLSSHESVLSFPTNSSIPTQCWLPKSSCELKLGITLNLQASCFRAMMNHPYPTCVNKTWRAKRSCIVLLGTNTQGSTHQSFRQQNCHCLHRSSVLGSCPSQRKQQWSHVLMFPPSLMMWNMLLSFHLDGSWSVR